MKLSVIRNACGNAALRMHHVRHGSRVSGTPLRCQSVGAAPSRLLARSASASANSGTNAKLADYFGKQSPKRDGDDFDRSLR